MAGLAVDLVLLTVLLVTVVQTVRVAVAVPDEWNAQTWEKFQLLIELRNDKVGGSVANLEHLS